jgi:two-component system response regulator (stage 0 sporulation protein F)
VETSANDYRSYNSVAEITPPQLRLEPRRGRILVADDDPDMRRLLAAVLHRDGHTVVEARDGMELIDHLARTMWRRQPDSFSVIVSDVQMPRLTGLDILAALRCTKWETPVIFVTAFGDSETQAKALSLGAVAILEKPLDFDHLRSAVQTALALR